MATNNTFVLGNMKDAIVKANIDCNKSAINADMCNKLGIPEQDFQQWKDYVQRLQDVTKDYLQKSHDIDATDKQLEAARGKIFAAWKDVLKNGTAEEYSPKFFIRKEDVTHIAGLCGEKFIGTAIGTRMANHTANDFRKNIERLVGVRMVLGGYLDDETADIILGYEGAVRTIKSKTAEIDGDEKTKTEGLKSTIAKLEKKLGEQTTILANFNVSEDARAAILGGIKKALQDARDALKTAEEKLAEAKTKRDNLEVKYNDTIAKLHRIDDTY